MRTAHEVLLGRSTTHHFTTEPVESAVIDRALRAAHQAPCHKTTWPWRFTLVGPIARGRIAEIAVSLKGQGRELTPEQVCLIRAKVESAGALIVVSQVLAADAFRREEDYAAVCCAVENLMLSVSADGLGSKWGTGGVTRDPQTYQVLGLQADVERVVGFIYVGTPARQCRVERPPVEGFIRRVA